MRALCTWRALLGRGTWFRLDGATFAYVPDQDVIVLGAHERAAAMNRMVAGMVALAMPVHDGGRP